MSLEPKTQQLDNFNISPCWNVMTIPAVLILPDEQILRIRSREGTDGKDIVKRYCENCPLNQIGSVTPILNPIQNTLDCFSTVKQIESSDQNTNHRESFLDALRAFTAAILGL